MNKIWIISRRIGSWAEMQSYWNGVLFESLIKGVLICQVSGLYGRQPGYTQQVTYHNPLHDMAHVFAFCENFFFAFYVLQALFLGALFCLHTNASSYQQRFLT